MPLRANSNVCFTATGCRAWIAAVALLVFGARAAHASHLPLWEAGAGASGLRMPAYRGASSVAYFAAPFPYFVYRGDRVRVEDDGVSGRLFQRRDLRLDISMGGNVPVRRERQGLRGGMPGLDPVVEIGPTLNWRLDDRSDRYRLLSVNLPWRAVVSGGSPWLAYRGFVVAPHAEWRQYLPRAGGDIGVRVTAGPLFGDSHYHEYFYGVDGAYATATRPSYQAEGGYSGARVTTTLSYYPTQHLSLALYVRYDNLTGATFARSPLVAQRDYLLLAFTVVWAFWQSDATAAHY